MVFDMAGLAATASSDYPGWPQIYLFDGNGSTAWSAAGNPSQYVQAQVTNAQVARAYSIQARTDNYSSAPGDFTLSGSNDGSSWTTLDTQTGQVFTYSEVKTYTFSNAIAYTYYRLNITAIFGGANWPSFAELSFDTVSSVPATTGLAPVSAGSSSTAFLVGILATTGTSPISIDSPSAVSLLATTRGLSPFGASSSSNSGLVEPGTTTGFSPIGIGSSSVASSYIFTDLEGIPNENNDIQITIELTGRLDPILPPPVPPVDFAGIADPTVGPTLTKSDTSDGHLLVGTYRYSYAGWKGSEGQATAPSPTADITLVAEDTVTLTFPTIANADGYLVYREEV